MHARPRFPVVVTRWLQAGAFALCAWCASAPAQKLAPIPSPTVRVNDNASMLTENQEATLDTTFDEYERTKKIRIVLLTIASSAPESIEVYGERTADAWKIGKPGGAGDVLILIARDNRGELHRVTIEVGRGQEAVLDPLTVKRIVNEDILPRFQYLDYYGGIANGVERIRFLLDGGTMPPPTARELAAAQVMPITTDWRPIVAAAVVALILVVCAWLFLRATKRRMCYLAGDRAVNRAFTPMIVGPLIGKSHAAIDEGNGFGGGYVGPGVGGYAGGGGDFSGGSASGKW